DKLDVIEVGEFAGVPLTGLPVATTGKGLVHEVVAENGGALGASPRNGAPEAGLRRPAVLLRQAVVPLGHVGVAVAAKAGQIEIEVSLLSQFEELAESFE